MKSEHKRDAKEHQKFPLPLQPTIISLLNISENLKEEGMCISKHIPNMFIRVLTIYSTFRAVCFRRISFDLNIKAAIQIATKKPATPGNERKTLDYRELTKNF